MSLVVELPPNDHESSLVKVFETSDPAFETFASMALRAEGIDFLVKKDSLRTLIPGANYVTESVQFWVSADSEPRARECIDEILSAPAHPVSVDVRGDLEIDSGDSEPYALQITSYSRETGQVSTKEVAGLSWVAAEHEIRAMDRYTKPIIVILTLPDNTETDCMVVTGGNGVYHLQIADSEAKWIEAVNPGGGDQEIDVWTSDQGFVTTQRFTWETDEALRIIEWYWRHQLPYPNVEWE